MSISSTILTQRQVRIPKRSERAIGFLTYAVGVDDTGVVYLSICENEGGGYFSSEWVSLPHLRECLADSMAEGSSVTASLLRRAYVSRSVNNGGFLAAILLHEGLLTVSDSPYRYRCTSDWEAWEASQRLPPAEASKESQPTRRKGKGSAQPPVVEESDHAED